MSFLMTKLVSDCTYIIFFAAARISAMLCGASAQSDLTCCAISCCSRFPCDYPNLTVIQCT